MLSRSSSVLMWTSLIALLAIGAARTVAYLVYAMADITSPYEVYWLEGKMVLLAFRAEAGLRFYPPWRDYPYVSNFFGPVYFGLVGLLGRTVDADIPGLLRIGRSISFLAGILTSLGVGAYLWRKFGAGEALIGALLCLAAPTLQGFSIMVRPDTLAGLFGFAGFFFATSRIRWAQLAGGMLLVLAVMTKQTTAVFLLAATLALLFEGRRRAGMLLFSACMATIVAIVATVDLVWEPNFAPSLLGESETPWNFAAWKNTLKRCKEIAPDVLYFSALAPVVLLGIARPRQIRLATLATVLLVTSLVTMAKMGSDLNYWLDARVSEALAAAMLWHLARKSTGPAQRTVIALATIVGAVILWPTAEDFRSRAKGSLEYAKFRNITVGRGVWRVYERIIEHSRDPNARVLTDSPLLEAYLGERAAFGDPWLLRMMVEQGLLKTPKMEQFIEEERYDTVYTLRDVNGPDYDDNELGLPMNLVARIKAHYVPSKKQADLFVYTPRGAPVRTSAPTVAPTTGPR